jgi:hypothetical protein
VTNVPRPALSTHTPCSYYFPLPNYIVFLLICCALASLFCERCGCSGFFVCSHSKVCFIYAFRVAHFTVSSAFSFNNCSRLLYHCTHTVNAFYATCTFQYVTLHVPGVVITSRGANSCTAAPDLGVFSKRVYGLSPDALNDYLILGNLQLHSLNFLHFSALTFCTSIWVTHILRHWLVCFLFLQFF